MLKKLTAIFAILAAGVFAGQTTVLEIDRDLADGSILEFDGTNFKGVAATSIDAALIGAGNVSSTEFGYLDGVTSSIQTQLGLKLDATALDDTAGDGDTTSIWSADKIFDQLALKQPTVDFSAIVITGGTITGITDLVIADGGTGASTADGARTALGLAIGTDVQAYSALLADIAAETFASGDLIQYDGANLAAVTLATLRQDTPNDQTGTAYTLVLSDGGRTVWMNNAAANVLTIPTNANVALPVGTKITVMQEGAGQTTVTADTGVTLNGSTAGSQVVASQYGAATLVKRTTDTWVIFGDLN